MQKNFKNGSFSSLITMINEVLLSTNLFATLSQSTKSFSLSRRQPRYLNDLNKSKITTALCIKYRLVHKQFERSSSLILIRVPRSHV